MTEIQLNVPFEWRTRELEIANSIREQNKFNVLDVCCRRFPRGYGIDIHPESNADLLCDAHNLEVFADDSFDLVLCVEGIEHLQNPGIAVKEWARVAKYALMITTQNAHCWRRWLHLSFSHWSVCTSPDHIYMWDEFTFRNFFRSVLPDKRVELAWYDRYLKKTRFLWPPKFFHENIAAFIWLNEDKTFYREIRAEAYRLINSRPERQLSYFAREYQGRVTNAICKGIG
jgi:SAM-dependent methyltransferase